MNTAIKGTLRNVNLKFNKNYIKYLLGFLVCLNAKNLVAESISSLRFRILQTNGAIEHGIDGKLATQANEAPRTPLGSLWKLFVYAYQTEERRLESPYVCTGQDPEEIFCCSPGESIDRDLALAQSCSPFFKLSRLAIEPTAWKSFWKSHITLPPTWLTEVAELKPETRISVDELLKVLLEIQQKFNYREKIAAATLGSVLFGTAKGALRFWGSSLRIKTFTWRDQETLNAKAYQSDDLGFVGGFAGWLPDGSAIWVSGAGHGRDALRTDLQSVVSRHMQSQNSGCVLVNYFDHYPVLSISPNAGPLVGKVKIKFKNGNEINFLGDGSLISERTPKDQIKVKAQMSVNEYVARVLQREVKTQPLEAARAFAVAIRSYLFQNAKERDSCLAINDSSTLQRVSPQKAAPEALQIAEWSDDLFLDRVKRLRYHSSQAGIDRMSWPQAKNLAEEGFAMREILKVAYPTGVLSFGHSVTSLRCLPNSMTENWFNAQAKSWKRKLNQEAGFETPLNLKICLNSELSGRGRDRVFSQPNAEEIYVPKLSSQQDEVSILHEYLHIAFRNHPRGRDEVFIEKLARNLLEVE